MIWTCVSRGPWEYDKLTQQQKLRRELQKSIDKALSLARGQGAICKYMATKETEEAREWDELFRALEAAKFHFDHASFLADERQAREGF